MQTFEFIVIEVHFFKKNKKMNWTKCGNHVLNIMYTLHHLIHNNFYVFFTHILHLDIIKGSENEEYTYI